MPKSTPHEPDERPRDERMADERHSVERSRDERHSGERSGGAPQSKEDLVRRIAGMVVAQLKDELIPWLNERLESLPTREWVDHRAAGNHPVTDPHENPPPLAEAEVDIGADGGMPSDPPPWLETALQEAAEIAARRAVSAVQTRIDADAELFGKLYDDLRAYRKGVLGEVLRPALMEMIDLFDLVSEKIEARERFSDSHGDMGAAPEDDLIPAGELIAELRAVRKWIELSMRNQGLTLFRLGNPGTTFDPARQKAVGVLPAPDPEMVGRVVRSVAPGFERDQAVLRKEMVDVYGRG